MRDLRSTIFWEPLVVTDETGRATITFYAADNPGSYSYILEGADMNGHIGKISGNIIVNK